MKTRRTWRKKAPAVAGRRRPAHELFAEAAALLRGRRGAWTAGGVLAVACALVAVWLLSGEDTARPPDSRARQYRDFNACLLTGDRGITAGTPAAPVWQGMQRASADTRARVTHVPVMGEQSTANALPHMNGLIQRQCDIVLATGQGQTEAVRKVAKGNPKTRFVVVGPAGESSPGAESGGARTGRKGGEGDANVTVLAPGDGLPDSVAETIRQAVMAAAS
ncbi:BMP family ABC transporter substrate-binding protein [Streptomyces sp. NPDC087845]|uniref:BMP family ABC transporter substrate-binding protein n=1 Tax=Streptomyces sp. NPDC087845 TaxID=3365806 RepID=UPI003814FB53